MHRTHSHRPSLLELQEHLPRHCCSRCWAGARGEESESRWWPLVHDILECHAAAHANSHGHAAAANAHLLQKAPAAHSRHPPPPIPHHAGCCRNCILRGRPQKRREYRAAAPGRWYKEPRQHIVSEHQTRRGLCGGGSREAPLVSRARNTVPAPDVHYVCMYVCTCVCMYRCVYTYLCTYVRAYLCTDAYIYIYRVFAEEAVAKRP